MTQSPFETTPLAIVGMACRFPGGESLDEFWSLLRDGRSGFSAIAPERLDAELHYSPERGALGRTYATNLGQVIQRPVDPAIVDIPGRVAERYDLTHLTMCEVAASACRHAGYDPHSLPVRRAGVYIGNSSVGDLEGDVTFHVHARHVAERLRRVPQLAGMPASDLDRLVADVTEALRRECPAGRSSRVDSFAAHSAAGLIGGLFGLTGPCYAADAACAASFKALLVAANALHLGRIDMAIVGAGACRSWCELVLMGIITAMTDDISRPFDAHASGLVPADGYGAVVLKTLPRALDDGDRIVGVVRGIGMSSDGRGKGFWAPKIEGQMEAMRRAYAGGADLSRVQYVQAHATSTQLGDVSEMEALAGVFSGSLASKIPVTSVKANIGHTLEAAGIAGLINTLLAMEHGTVPPAANVTELNADIPWSDIPFHVPLEPLAWERPGDGPRRAGVNAFGIGGLNTHVVIDDVPEAAFAGRFTPAPDKLSHGRAQKPGFSERSTTIASDCKAEAGLLSADKLAACRHDAVAVIGLGCVLPEAPSLAAFIDLLDSGRDPKSVVPAERWDRSVPVDLPTGDTRPLSGEGGFLSGYEFDWKKHKIPPFQVANANPLQFWLVDAVDQALADARLGIGAGKTVVSLDRSRTTTLVGAAFTHDFCNNGHLGVRLPEMNRAIGSTLASYGWDDAVVSEVAGEFSRQLVADSPCLRDETGSYSSSTLASRIAKQLDFGGGAFSIDAGDASGIAAISAGVDLLRTGYCDTVVCAAGQRNMDLVRFAQLAETDVAPAEGAVAVVLKRLDDARRDGDPIRAVIRDVQQAAPAAGVPLDASPVPLVFIESAAASCGPHDEATSDACQCAGQEMVATLSTQMGHLQGASSLAALVKAIAQLERGHVLGSAADCSANESATTAPRRTVDAAVSATMSFGEAAAGRNDAWRLLIAGEGPWPVAETSSVEPASRGAHVGALNVESEADGRTPEELVFDTVVEFTGYPRDLLTLDDDIESDLHLAPAQLAALVQALDERLSVPPEDAPTPRTVRDLVDRVASSVE